MVGRRRTAPIAAPYETAENNAVAHAVLSTASESMPEPHPTMIKALKVSALQPCNFQAGVCAAANNPFTGSLNSAIIVKIPRIIPKGMKRHSIQAITSAKV
jgi:hypothetical protein